MTRYLRRRIKRLLRKPKFSRSKTEILKLRIFYLICFIKSPEATGDDNQVLFELFRIATSLAAEYFQKFLLLSGIIQT
jgi:hypothetical protein